MAAIDTHKIFKNLVTAGFPEDQAEVMVNAYFLVCNGEIIDTYRVVKDLIASGLPENQAEVIANIFFRLCLDKHK